MKPKDYVVRQAYLGPRGLVLDGVRLPWFIGPDVDVEDLSGRGSLWGLTVTFYADRVLLTTPDGETRDTLLETAREDALRIVREGLADVLEWLGEDGAP